MTSIGPLGHAGSHVQLPPNSQRLRPAAVRRQPRRPTHCARSLFHPAIPCARVPCSLAEVARACDAVFYAIMVNWCDLPQHLRVVIVSQTFDAPNGLPDLLLPDMRKNMQQTLTSKVGRVSRVSRELCSTPSLSSDLTLQEWGRCLLPCVLQHLLQRERTAYRCHQYHLTVAIELIEDQRLPSAVGSAASNVILSKEQWATASKRVDCIGRFLLRLVPTTPQPKRLRDPWDDGNTEAEYCMVMRKLDSYVWDG